MSQPTSPVRKASTSTDLAPDAVPRGIQQMPSMLKLATSAVKPRTNQSIRVFRWGFPTLAARARTVPRAILKPTPLKPRTSELAPQGTNTKEETKRSKNPINEALISHKVPLAAPWRNASWAGFDEMTDKIRGHIMSIATAEYGLAPLFAFLSYFGLSWICFVILAAYVVLIIKYQRRAIVLLWGMECFHSALKPLSDYVTFLGNHAYAQWKVTIPVTRFNYAIANSVLPSCYALSSAIVIGESFRPNLFGDREREMWNRGWSWCPPIAWMGLPWVLVTGKVIGYAMAIWMGRSYFLDSKEHRVNACPRNTDSLEAGEIRMEPGSDVPATNRTGSDVSATNGTGSDVSAANATGSDITATNGAGSAPMKAVSVLQALSRGAECFNLLLVADTVSAIVFGSVELPSHNVGKRVQVKFISQPIDGTVSGVNQNSSYTIHLDTLSYDPLGPTKVVRDGSDFAKTASFANEIEDEEIHYWDAYLRGRPAKFAAKVLGGTCGQLYFKLSLLGITYKKLSLWGFLSIVLAITCGFYTIAQQIPTQWRYACLPVSFSRKLGVNRIWELSTLFMVLLITFMCLIRSIGVYACESHYLNLMGGCIAEIDG